ncbi:MAG: sortase [Anaerolineales bacterium]|nr:sortase [Anaerolineales bacterium]
MSNRLGIQQVLIIAILFSLVLGFGNQSTTPSYAEDYALPYYVERVTDIAKGGNSSNPAWFVEVNGNLYFQADDRQHGTELWKYSPLSGEATLAADIYPGSVSSNPEWLTVYGNSIYFAATNATLGRQLWRYNTGSGIAEPVDVHEYWDAPGAPTGTDPKWLAFMGSILFYSADMNAAVGRELYAYDVRDGRSWLVKNIWPTSDDSDPRYLFAFGSTLYFTAKDELHGEELWRSDGTDAGTYLVKDILAGPRSSSPSSFNILGNMFVFAADDWVHGRELWRSYGTEATTSLASDINNGDEDSSPGWSNRLARSMVFFPAETDEFGVELWRYDPQLGAYMLDDINPNLDDDGDPESSNPAAIGDVGWVMFFSADDGDTGVELWKTEPPYTYASQVADIYPGADRLKDPYDSNPKTLERMGTTLFFTAQDDEHGEEVWATEFPYTQAHLLKDIRPGSRGSIPEYTLDEFTGTLSGAYRMGWTIYFTANDGKHGVELWQISLGALPTTGFAPDVITDRLENSVERDYQSLDEMQLRIPSLQEEIEIVGVPKVGNTWDVDWLEPDQVGYLEGTAFPTWEGNSVISAHVYNVDGSPGPFANLQHLSFDDEIIIRAWGQDYVYRIREIHEWLDPNNEQILEHKDHDWVTLITCKGYDQSRDIYWWRTAVQAVLVEIVDEH